MSIQAVSWVLDDENVPGIARLVLISLANHADAKTGHCWPSVATIAKEAKISPRSVHTYLGALRRNGYIMIESGRSNVGTQRSNNYWILFDREKTEWEFNQTEDKNDRKILNTSAPDSHIEDSEETQIQPLDCEPRADLADGISAPACRQEPSESQPSESIPREESERRPAAMRPAPYDPKARKEEQARLKAAEQARKPKMVPVIQGTRWWAAWLRHGHKPSLVTNIISQGQSKRGWYFPSQLPPNSTGPPIEGAELADELDETEAVE